jgi:hypothetical protein
MTKPVRLQLSRRAGFNLQAVSKAANGLEAVKVARPGIWGNPFIVKPEFKSGRKVGGSYICVPTVEDAVACYREMFQHEGETADMLRKRLPDLRGKNLACFCKPDQLCHADILLELANAEHPEAA